MKIILASKSPYRKKQLLNAGWKFETLSTDYDEDHLKKEISDPFELCDKLAEGKAMSLAQKMETIEKTIVIGADQLVNFNGQILGKAGDPTSAAIQLSTMSGQSHDLVTSVCLVIVDPKDGAELKKVIHQEVCRIKIKNLNLEAFQAYVKKDESWDCAGSYKIEKHGREIIDEIFCNDESAIIGLPMIWLNKKLKELQNQ